jgi:hypothetical protein
MHGMLQLLLDRLQLGPHPLGDRHTLDRKRPLPGLAATVRETQEVERLRLACAPFGSPGGRKAAELDQAGLVGMHLQSELRQTLPHLLQEAFRVAAVLEAQDEVVRVPHEDQVSVGATTSPLLDPLVQDVVQEHVRQERGDHRALGCPYGRLGPLAVLRHPRLQPLAQQPQDASVGDPVFEEPGPSIRG